MTIRWLRGVAASAVLVGGFGAWACSAAVGDDRGDDRGEGLAEMAVALDETRSEASKVVDLLVGDGLDTSSATLNFGSCNDFGFAALPTATAWFDRRDGGRAERADAERVRDLLADAGWAITESDLYVDGIENRSDTRYGVAASRGEIRVRVLLFNDASGVGPDVVADVYGACVDNTEIESQLYIGLTTWNLAPPEATVGVEPEPTPTQPPEMDEADSAGRMFGEVMRAARETMAALEAGFGYVPTTHLATFTACEDGFAPTTTVTLQAPQPGAATEAHAATIREALLHLGWIDDVASSTETEPVDDRGWSLTMRSDVIPGVYDPFRVITLRGVVAADSGRIDVAISGLCLPASPGAVAFYEAMGTWSYRIQRPNDGPSGTEATDTPPETT